MKKFWGIVFFYKFQINDTLGNEEGKCCVQFANIITYTGNCHTMKDLLN